MTGPSRIPPPLATPRRWTEGMEGEARWEDLIGKVARLEREEEARRAQLAAALEELREPVADLNRQTAALRDRVAAAEDKVATLQTQVDELRAMNLPARMDELSDTTRQLTALGTRMDQVQGEAAQLSGQISGLDQSIGALALRVDALESA